MIASLFALWGIAAQAPVPVHVVRSGEGWRLERGGRPYLIKGAGGSYSLSELAAIGGNSIRTWGADRGEAILDDAQRHGLTVLMGIWLGHKEQGFHYDDPAQVRKQMETAREYVMRYRNHPALLAWGLGNEMEGYAKGDDPQVWHAVEDIAKMVKELDPNHPTMTVIAEIGGEKLPSIAKYCPDIDIVGVNSYGGAPSLPTRYRAGRVDRPYVLTEFGPPGQWETGKTTWGAPYELTSTEKAARYRDSYQKAVLDQPGLSLGSYAFTWGFKQEATSTWYGLVLPDGSKVGGVDALSELWTGHPVEWPCPQIESFKLDGPATVAPGSTIRLHLTVRDPRNELLRAEWMLMDEQTVHGVGGTAEPTPAAHPEAIREASIEGATIRIPDRASAYRVFVTVRNPHHGAATANVPLLAR